MPSGKLTHRLPHHQKKKKKKNSTAAAVSADFEGIRISVYG